MRTWRVALLRRFALKFLHGRPHRANVSRQWRPQTSTEPASSDRSTARQIVRQLGYGISIHGEEPLLEPLPNPQLPDPRQRYGELHRIATQGIQRAVGKRFVDAAVACQGHMRGSMNPTPPPLPPPLHHPPTHTHHWRACLGQQAGSGELGSGRRACCLHVNGA
jgi:hypothetical protein